MSHHVDAADRKLRPSIMGSLFGHNYDEAIDLYQQAINQLKLEKAWEQAASVYTSRLVPTAEKNGAARYELARYYTDAGDCLKKISVKRAIQPYESAVKLFQTDGKYPQAGKLLKKIGEELEEEQIGDGRSCFLGRVFFRNFCPP